jgi:hypothetical protein
MIEQSLGRKDQGFYSEFSQAGDAGLSAAVPVLAGTVFSLLGSGEIPLLSSSGVSRLALLASKLF